MPDFRDTQAVIFIIHPDKDIPIARDEIARLS
jgi:hypothetical protein